MSHTDERERERERTTGGVLHAPLVTTTHHHITLVGCPPCPILPCIRGGEGGGTTISLLELTEKTKWRGKGGEGREGGGTVLSLADTLKSMSGLCGSTKLSDENGQIAGPVVMIMSHWNVRTSAKSGRGSLLPTREGEGTPSVSSS